MVKMEAQVQNKQLLKHKKVSDEANKQITYLMQQLWEGARKTTPHMKKIMEIFCKQTEEHVKIATATASALQDWYGQEIELQVIQADKANRT